jgi:hypothetical protein
MELIHAYLTSRINYRLWITDPQLEIYEVQIESAKLKENPTWFGVYTGEVTMEKWVYEEINKNAKDWTRRIRLLITEDGYGNTTSYKIFSDVFRFQKNGEGDPVVVYRFSCKKEGQR